MIRLQRPFSQERDGYPMLAMFSKRGRQVNCQKQFPEYRFYLRVPFVVLLERLRDGVGFIINAYDEAIPFALAPDHLKHVKEALLPPGHPPTEPPPLPKR